MAVAKTHETAIRVYFELDGAAPGSVQQLRAGAAHGGQHRGGRMAEAVVARRAHHHIARPHVLEPEAAARGGGAVVAGHQHVGAQAVAPERDQRSLSVPIDIPREQQAAPERFDGEHTGGVVVAVPGPR